MFKTRRDQATTKPCLWKIYDKTDESLTESKMATYTPPSLLARVDTLTFPILILFCRSLVYCVRSTVLWILWHY